MVGSTSTLSALDALSMAAPTSTLTALDALFEKLSATQRAAFLAKHTTSSSSSAAAAVPPRPWSDADRSAALKALEKPYSYLQPRSDVYRTMHHWLCLDAAPTNATSVSLAKAWESKAVADCLARGKGDLKSPSLVREGGLSLHVNGKTLLVDDIVYGYEILMERRRMFSQITYLGVGMQQDPNDALVIADLLWRVRPRLLIELGTSGGGSALFYARAMRGYDPHSRVLTFDPARGKTRPLENWNHGEMDAFCPHCARANETALWKEAVTYVRDVPTSKKALALATAAAAEATRDGYAVLVMEDSDHTYEHVLPNLDAYAHLVTRGSYMIVQDLRTGRGVFEGAARAVDNFLSRHKPRAGGAHHHQLVHRARGATSSSTTAAGASTSPPEFVRDRRPEYLLFSQHTGGFLRRV